MFFYQGVSNFSSRGNQGAMLNATWRLQSAVSYLNNLVLHQTSRQGEKMGDKGRQMESKGDKGGRWNLNHISKGEQIYVFQNTRTFFRVHVLMLWFGSSANWKYQSLLTQSYQIH